MELISYAGLLKTVTRFANCYETLAKEFIVNIPVNCVDHKSKEYRKVFVRGKCVEFSPSIINRFLVRSEDVYCELEVTNNLVCRAITANQVSEWPMKNKLPVRKLSVKYVILHRIGASNWVPTNHTSTIYISLGKFIYTIGNHKHFDYGTYIFDQTMTHSGTCAIKMPITFPYLLCRIILNQHPGILSGNDVLCKRKSALTLHFKLFSGKHVPDIVLTFAPAENKTSKDDMITELREACKELDDVIRVIPTRKLTFEKMIKELQKDNNIDDRVSSEGGDSSQEGSFGSAKSTGPEDSQIICCLFI